MARVLVIDDNRDMVDTLVALLGVTGHTCFPCYSGTAALTRVKEHDPDVVVLDVRMPGMDGWSVARQIREAIPGKRPVLIAVSGEHGASAQVPAQVAMVGIDYFLMKPADHNVLLSLIEKAATR
jgi:CheY-like chemotaxis protein